MNNKVKELSNPFSTGGGGTHFENNVQTAFTILMLADGFTPCFDALPIVKILLQGKYKGFNTDDMIVFAEDPITKKQNKLLTQIKHSISITNQSKLFGEVIKDAWEDFKNKDFDQNDKIALITGPLSAIDTNHTRTLLEQAKYSENEHDFIVRIEKGKFTSNEQRSKLNVFKKHLKNANKGNEVTEKQLWNFLKVFHLIIYDLDIKGVALSLLYTIINYYARNEAESIWGQVNDQIQNISHNAGMIKKSTIRIEIRNKFIKPDEKEIPEKYLKESKKDLWNKNLYIPELISAGLLGAWNEKSEADKALISKLTKKEYETWISKLREILQLDGSPISFENGIWKVKNKIDLLKDIGSNIFDEHIDSFKECSLIVLKEIDPKFELPKEERYTAKIYNKVFKHSNVLRKSIAETLAILNNNDNYFKYCSSNKVKWATALIVREILQNADWLMWISLSDLLPIIAEISPDEFLDAVEFKLNDSEDTFIKIFNQESSGVFGNIYITGLLWALEILGWDDNYFIRVTTLLGELASIDPGGNWSNRPKNSLIEMYLPWLPHTFASFEKRKAGLKSLNREFPDVAWRLVIKLLPNQHQSSSGTNKPKWVKLISNEFETKVTNKEYWEQIIYYSDYIVENCKNNIELINEVINNLDNLPKESFNKLLRYLSSKSIIELKEEKRLHLWNSLIDFTNKHKKYSDAKWALPSTLISKIDKVANKLKPKEPMNIYARLFVDADHDLYDEKGNWEEQRKRLEDKRQEALKIILKNKKGKSIFDFIDKVESSYKLGSSFGAIADSSYDKKFLPLFLNIDNRKRELFINGYILGKFAKVKWEWVDKLVSKKWTKNQIAEFYKILPFSTDTWKRVDKNLSNEEDLYWQKVYVNPWLVDGDINYAVDKLLKYNRPISALDCVYYSVYDKNPVEVNKIIIALLDSSVKGEPNKTIDVYHTVETIKYLQQNKNVSEKYLFQIEWAYLQLLDGLHGAKPKFIESQLANDPKLFCEVIQSLYRSKNQKVEKKEFTENEKNIATNSWHLLHNWRVTPGSDDSGNFDEKKFISWFKEVKVICEKSGHLDVSMNHVGQVLFYTPPDKSGFWINEKVAEILNQKDNDKLRSGFDVEVFNSRGVHFVDPEGKPELVLAEEYIKKANDTENAGYGRFATTLRKIAESLKAEAEHNIREHKKEIEESE